jgi:dihydrofolate reductase
MNEMRGRGIRRAWLVGGGRLAAAFRAEGLLTEHIVSVIPLLLGSGIRLFDGPGPAEPLRLLGARTYESGIVQLRYTSPK